MVYIGFGTMVSVRNARLRMQSCKLGVFQCVRYACCSPCRSCWPTPAWLGWDSASNSWCVIAISLRSPFSATVAGPIRAVLSLFFRPSLLEGARGNIAPQNKSDFVCFASPICGPSYLQCAIRAQMAYFLFDVRYGASRCHQLADEELFQDLSFFVEYSLKAIGC